MVERYLDNKKKRRGEGCNSSQAVVLQREHEKVKLIFQLLRQDLMTFFKQVIYRDH